MRDAAGASCPDWSDGRSAKDGWAALYPLGLSGLTFDETRAHFAGPAPPPGPDAEVAAVLGNADNALRFAHRLTDGHLGGMRLVLATMSLECRRVGARNVDVRGLFARPVSEGGRSLAEETRQLLVSGWSVERHRALVRSTAARDFGERSLAAVLQGEPDPVAHMMSRFRSRDLWVRHPPGAEAKDSPTLRPFPRRGVMHLLAQSCGRHEPTWDEVHNQLRTHAEDRGDPISAMYHCLALGRVAAVAEYLSSLLTSEDTGAWYAALTAVTQAPLAHPAQEADSRQHWLRLVKKVEEFRNCWERWHHD